MTKTHDDQSVDSDVIVRQVLRECGMSNLTCNTRRSPYMPCRSSNKLGHQTNEFQVDRQQLVADFASCILMYGACPHGSPYQNVT